MAEIEARISETMFSREERNREAKDLVDVLSDSLKVSPVYNEVISSPTYFGCGNRGEFYYRFDDDSLHIGFVSAGVLVEVHSHKGTRLGMNDGKAVTRDTVYVKKGDEGASLSQEFRDGEPYESHFSHKSADKKWMLDKPTVSADILGFFESLKAS